MRKSSRPIHQRSPQAFHRSPARHASEDETSATVFLRHIGKSLAITLLAASLLMISASLAAYFLPDPAIAIPPLALLAAALTAMIGGFSAARIHQHAALLCGLANGSLFMLGMILVSLFLRPYASGYGALEACLLHVGFLLCSVVGAYLGIRKSAPRKKRKY